MRTDEPLAHRLEGSDFLWRQIGEPDRLTRIDQGVLADQILDLSFGAGIERVIGGAHIGKLSVGAPGGQHAPGKQRVLRRDRAERAVGMPEPVAELEEPDPVLIRDDVAVFVEVGEIRDPRPEPAVLAPSYVPRRVVALKLPEMARERDLFFVGDVLVAQYQHGVFVHARLDCRDLIGAQWVAAMDTRDLSNEVRMCLVDRYGHSITLLWRISLA